MSSLSRNMKNMKLSGSSKKKKETPSKGGAIKARRRLSVAAGDPRKKAFTKLDGASNDEKKRTKVRKRAGKSSGGKVFGAFCSNSNVGFVPFNPNKVNQDRACAVTSYGKNEDNAFFGVFDGHGSLGHEVSSYVSSELPRFLLRQKNYIKEPVAAITRAFVECNSTLARGEIDCTFSGTTAICCVLYGKKLYSCNAGDSRAVLARKKSDGSTVAIGLSDDHKPERPDEKKRIESSKGRVEACKGQYGEDIGPPRVWLLHQDVPGLAMTRSFGDLIAASVGVIARPEIWERDITKDDQFMILASDGVWEFIDNQEAVDIVVQAKGDPELACKLLCQESTKRWQMEEEVIDDITALVIYFNKK